MDELLLRSAAELAGLIRAASSASSELVDASLRRIDELEPQINAFTHVAHESALAAAAEIGPDDPRPFAGVPIAVKDNRPVAGMPITLCSDLFADLVARPRRLPGPPAARGGLRDRRQDRAARDGDPAHHRVAPVRPDPQPVGARSHPGRIERRVGRRGRRRDGPDRPRQRRRRLDPDPGRLLRPGRAEAGPGAGSRWARCRRQFSGLRRRADPDRRETARCWTCWPGTSSGTPPGRRRPRRRSPRRRAASRGGCGSAWPLNPPLRRRRGRSGVRGRRARDAADLLESLGHDVRGDQPPSPVVGPGACCPTSPGRSGPNISMTALIGARIRGREATADGRRAADVDDVRARARAGRARRTWARGPAEGDSPGRSSSSSSSSTSSSRRRSASARCRSARSTAAGPDPWDHYRRSGYFTPFTAICNITGLPAIALPLYQGDDGLPTSASS